MTCDYIGYMRIRHFPPQLTPGESTTRCCDWPTLLQIHKQLRREPERRSGPRRRDQRDARLFQGRLNLLRVERADARSITITGSVPRPPAVRPQHRAVT